jgi:hypothetical protein
MDFHDLPKRWLAGHRERKHGRHCSCRPLADAATAASEAIDYGFCRRVLQRRWRMACDHIPEIRPRKSPHGCRRTIRAIRCRSC